ncbi:HesA/MoeB/ThiF family protein [Desulfobulbus alkaliphilus]|uniref:HesA/MoeB/ThiF family protein n=1 Tax=Desulfobulbus alkaliphilus TaxID=869814 RepID=UPI0019669BC0|nr:ThiF family adenylyltransferase [Desulfobulbus alkaliphilus]MBM9536480.1 ThiF family adenylyltransferase [Desulfobulbus alkaliphilus]
MEPFKEYFVRNQGALTLEQQQTLDNSHVAVVGCGGLGGYVIEQLVRIGIGRMDVFDPDVFTASNCNRQLNALTATLGCNKAEIAAHRARCIHPFARVTAWAVDFRDVPQETWPAVDAVVDCLDSIEARRDLARLCGEHKQPLIHGAVNAWCGQVGVQRPGDDLLARLYPDRAPRLSSPSPPSVLVCTVVVVAGLQVSETIKVLLGEPSSLRNNWMHIDLKHGDFATMG